MYGPLTMKTKEEKAAKKLQLKKQAAFKHRMEVMRTSCGFLGLMLNLWVVCHVYLKAV